MKDSSNRVAWLALRDRQAIEAWAREVMKRLANAGRLTELYDDVDQQVVNPECLKVVADTIEEAFLTICFAGLDADPYIRRLHRVLYMAAGILAADNWYESPENMEVLDRVKRHLPNRYRWALNRILVREP